MAALAYQPSLLDALPEAPARPRLVEAPRSGDEHVPAPNEAAAGGDAAPAESASAEPARRTFEDVVVAAWEGLAVAHSATCVVCGGDVRPRYGAGAKPVAGTCRDCGTEIL